MKKRTVLRSRLGLVPLLIAILFSALSAAPAVSAEKYAAIVVDANTGRTLYSKNPDAHRFPASLTKMMTLYILFEELDAKRLTLNSRLSVSANAASQPPSKLGVRAGSSVKVEAAILSLTTKSANDVAVVVAENVGGSVPAFAARMNRTARSLGMTSTTFRNPNGLPDPGQWTTARDLFKLARALQTRFPTYYRYFGVRTFAYGGHRIRNHNNLLGRVDGVDGIKTGYTRASGFNLVTNVRRDNRHIIAVVMGGKTASRRDADMRRLIDKYMPAASHGRPSDAVITAEADVDDAIEDAPAAVADAAKDASAGDDSEEGPAADTEDAEDLIADAAPDSGDSAADVRLPRARPGHEAQTLAYAPPVEPRDIVSAAMTDAAADTDPAQGDVSDDADDDPIALRISAATEVAELATAEPDPTDRLAELARIRAGEQDIVASGPARHAVEETANEDGWHIQIGAVPTLEGAEALIEQAKSSVGGVLASRKPLTQEVERNGTTLYRARFGGFSDKDEARAACDKLKRHAIACLAVPS